jgi:hypothetical protein
VVKGGGAEGRGKEGGRVFEPRAHLDLALVFLFGCMGLELLSKKHSVLNSE